MTEEEIKKLVAEFMPHIRAAKDEAGEEKLILLLARDIEREVRQRAHRLAQNAANQIAGLDYECPELNPQRST